MFLHFSFPTSFSFLPPSNLPYAFLLLHPPFPLPFFILLHILSYFLYYYFLAFLIFHFPSFLLLLSCPFPFLPSLYTFPFYSLYSPFSSFYLIFSFLCFLYPSPFLRPYTQPLHFLYFRFSLFLVFLFPTLIQGEKSCIPGITKSTKQALKRHTRTIITSFYSFANTLG